MALELMVDGDIDMGEGEELAHVERIRKGKQRDQDQPTEREDGLQIMVDSTSDQTIFFSVPFPTLP